MDYIDDSIFSGCSVLFLDVVSDPEIVALERRRNEFRIQVEKQISLMLVPLEIAMQYALQDPKAQVPEPSAGIQDGEDPQAQASKAIQVEQAGGESWMMQEQVLGPFSEQTNRSARVHEIPETSSNPKRRCGRPPKDSAPRPKNLPKQNSTQGCRRRKRNFILPQGWIKEVRARKNGESAGHKDTYYIETSTQHVCRSLGEVMDYMDNKEKESQMSNQDNSAGGVHLPVDLQTIFDLEKFHCIFQQLDGSSQ